MSWLLVSSWLVFIQALQLMCKTVPKVLCDSDKSAEDMNLVPGNVTS